MTDLRTAAQQALDALKCLVEAYEMQNMIRADINDAEYAIKDLRAALEQLSPTRDQFKAAALKAVTPWEHIGLPSGRELPYPPQKEERTLTDEVIADLWHQNGGFHHHFARAVERWLKGKNHA